MRNTFFDNAQLYGMPYPVEGGTDTAYIYEVWIENEGKPTQYIKIVDNKPTCTKNYKEVTPFTEDCAKEVAEFVLNALKEHNPDVKVKIVPKGHYETIREKTDM